LGPVVGPLGSGWWVREGGGSKRKALMGGWCWWCV
jgi:hypothetical protein